MAINKVEFGGKTLIDISDSSVAKNNLLLGETAYGPDGEKVVGSLTIGYYTPSVSQPQEDTMEIAFLPSVNDMPNVEPVELPLPTGPQGVGIKAITMENTEDDSIVEPIPGVYSIDKKGNAWFAGKVYVGGSGQDDAATLVTASDAEALFVKKLAELNAMEVSY